MAKVLTIGHSADADDAFMFYALTQGKLETGDYEFRHVLMDIESLNHRALRGELEVSAISAHAYAYVADRYALLPCGASMGKGYGPILIARRRLTPEELAGQVIAVPGTLTTAFLLLQLWLKQHRSPNQLPFLHRALAFDTILEAVRHNACAAGLLIHEGQLTYQDFGLCKIVDLGEWWHQETGLPLPLGMNVVRKDLGMKTMRDIARLLRQSIEYALKHRDEALAYALQFGRGLDHKLADDFVGMYVNEYTLDVGSEGKKAVETLLHRGREEGIISKEAEVEWVSM